MLKKYLNPEKLTTLLLYFSILVFLIAFNFQHNPPGGWYQQFMPFLNNRPLSDITFTDSLTGYAITGDNTNGDTNYILKTTNGGDNWNILSSVYRDLSRVIFLNNLTGYVCGGYNTASISFLIKTTDGGNSWNQITTPSSLRITDMSVLSEDTMWIIDYGINDNVYRTTNGGLNWQLQFSTGSTLNKIYMYNGNFGFFGSVKSNFLWRTTNSGINWTQVPGENGFRDIFFTDSLIGWKTSPIKKTTNGGLTWVTQYTATGGYIQSSFVYNFQPLNKDTIWGIGGYVLYPNNQIRAILHFTSNGGQYWLYQIPDTSIHISSYSFIFFTDKDYGWTYRNSPTGIHTKVGGDTVFYSGIVNLNSEVPSGFKLYQNYPNPFNPRTVIRYDIFKASNVKLTVYDINGREQMKLVDQHQPAGTYEVDFMGNFSPSGVYFYMLSVGDFVDTKKMILLK